ncbi:MULTISPECIES: prolyl oligopeptidase family protein [unclassified Okeania]|uniref:prolyl oligopeptidase family serine peptidase n=1 Tax=unclassified Okeania TaxID=2634635 RepID=UPI0013B8C5E6|nr:MULTISPECIES: prolyl oligopeptidase family serine peptidase [unclassified Okeania]NES77787.1 S9 family peptidase [Okeania sp. SIO1H4]NET13902.1 S9 family peptidase [Okeania sp. SIO1H6]NET19436.1 S9 family peptidase [Okeania sp. SIO1H5]NET94157.1 S9 family peptidase [Okeania sp. SIO1H2]
MKYSKEPLTYPITHKTDIVENYHGVEVADPYRWLEDPNSEETQEWVKSQNEITFNYLAEISEGENIKKRLTKIWDYEKYSVPFKQGDRYFYYKNDGLQNQSILYTLPTLDAEPKVLIDPNKLSEDGTVALSGIAISKDGKLIAYGISKSGSDWQEWRIKNIETGEDLPDVLQWIKFNVPAWKNDNQGLFYSRYEQPQAGELEETNYLQKIYYHSLGTPQSDDVLIYEKPERKEWSFNCYVTEDSKYLVITVWQSTDRKNLVFYQDLTIEDAPIVELISEFEAEYRLIDNDDNIFWFVTDFDAPKRRVIAIDINNSPSPSLVTGENKDKWQEIIPETTDTLRGVGTLNNQFVAFYLKDAHTQVKIFNLDGSPVRNVDLPGIGSVGGFYGKRHDTTTFYSYVSFTTPSTIYQYDMVSGESKIYRQPTVDFNPDEFETKQIFYSSKDGTRIPMFITHKKGVKLDGNNPTILYGYGGFSISLTPNFSISRLVWLEMGGVYAVANIRGGGEYGEEWHKAGIKQQKQNVFDDFISAAEWLIENKWTSSKKLAITGASNGGLLVGACMTQRPELFGAALPAVGVMDMLRFPKFTIGWAWVDDYGSPDNPEEFKALYAYSPLHNLKPEISYPATLVTTADHDDRVVPAHSFKFISALQAAHVGDNPVLIRIETKAGHGAGKPTTKIIEEITDEFAFLLRNFEIELPENFSN